MEKKLDTVTRALEGDGEGNERRSVSDGFLMARPFLSFSNGSTSGSSGGAA